MQTTTFAVETQSSESMVPAWDTLPRHFIFFCCPVMFSDQAVLSGLTMTLASPSMVIGVDSTKTKVAEPAQDWTPSNHVWSNRVSPASPQFLNQAPPRAQQLSSSDFWVILHLRHLLLLLLLLLTADSHFFVGAAVGNAGVMITQQTLTTMLHHFVVVNRPSQSHVS